MKEVKFSGTVIELNNCDWILQNENNTILSADILDGIDQILKVNDMYSLSDREEIEIIIKLKSR